MAVDICSDFPPTLVASPRISFSHDLVESDLVLVECPHRKSDHFSLQPTIDFDFNFNTRINQSSCPPAMSSADELFSNGKILPVDVKNTPPVMQSTSLHGSTPTPFSNQVEDTQKKKLKDFLTTTFDEEDEDDDKKPPTKQFWQFQRSSSLNVLNCENGRRNNGLIKSLQFLSRSNSTGSAPNPKTNVPQKVTRREAIARSVSQKEHSIKRSSSQKEPKILPRSSSVSSSTQFYAFSSGKKASLRKSYSNVIRINPVLNITPTFFTKATVNLFGLCSFLSNSKSNKKKK